MTAKDAKYVHLWLSTERGENVIFIAWCNAKGYHSLHSHKALGGLKIMSFYIKMTCCHEPKIVIHQ